MADEWLCWCGNSVQGGQDKCPACKSPRPSGTGSEDPSSSSPSMDGASGASAVRRKLDGLGEGYVIADQYRITSVLGKGAMSVVFRCDDLKRDAEVALKFLLIENATEEALARFGREVNVMTQLEHPNIARIYDHGDFRGIPYMSMEMIKGMPLSKVIKLAGGLKINKFQELALPICSSIQAVHNLEIIHRDIKSDNIVVDRDGVPHLLDFGVAKQMGDPMVTQAGMAIGTPYYMAPEIALGVGEVDHRADLYSLGVLLFEMLANRYPFDNRKPIEVMLAHVQEEPPELIEVRPDVPKEVSDVISRCLVKNRDDRFQNAQEISDALSAALGIDPDTTNVSMPAYTGPEDSATAATDSGPTRLEPQPDYDDDRTPVQLPDEDDDDRTPVRNISQDVGPVERVILAVPEGVARDMLEHLLSEAVEVNVAEDADDLARGLDNGATPLIWLDSALLDEIGDKVLDSLKEGARRGPLVLQGMPDPAALRSLRPDLCLASDPTLTQVAGVFAGWLRPEE